VANPAGAGLFPRKSKLAVGVSDKSAGILSPLRPNCAAPAAVFSPEGLKIFALYRYLGLDSPRE